MVMVNVSGNDGWQGIDELDNEVVMFYKGNHIVSLCSLSIVIKD